MSRSKKKPSNKSKAIPSGEIDWDGVGRRLTQDGNLDAIRSTANALSLAILGLTTCMLALQANRMKRIQSGRPDQIDFQLHESQSDDNMKPVLESISRIKHFVELGLDLWLSRVKGLRPGQWTHELLAKVDEAQGLCVLLSSPVFDRLPYDEQKHDELRRRLNVYSQDVIDLPSSLASLAGLRLKPFADADGSSKSPSIDLTIDDFRNGPSGALLTATECRKAFGLSGADLSRKAKIMPDIRIKNPYGRGHLYRYDAVSLMANRKDRDDD